MLPQRDTIPSRMTPLVTRAMMLVNAVVFFFDLALPDCAPAGG
jgi:hypothetical protein